MSSDSTSNIPPAEAIFPMLPRTPTNRSNTHTIYNMSSPSTTPTLHAPPPTPAMSNLSLLDDSQTTPTPKEKNASSKSYLSTMTPPDSSRGAPLVVNSSTEELIDPSDKIFVKSHNDDDVFGRSSSTTPGQTARVSSTTTVTKVQTNLTTPVSFKQTPRQDRMNSPITPANAQGVLPPEACVFVANLATGRPDDQLEVSCRDHFGIFGECHIKVRRDKHRHPFALVQYHNIEDANNAIRSSHDVILDGRNIRCEHAEVRRSVVLTKIGGGTVTADEAKEVLGSFGPISELHPTTNKDARELGIPEGMWVQFAYYLDFKDAVRSFNNTTTEYRIYAPPEVEAQTRTGPLVSPAAYGFRNARSSSDQKSIFVGNLPAGTTEHHLKQLFSSSGIIRAVNIIHKPIQGASGYNVFGFVEFSTVGEAEIAANREVEINGAKIRVEPKEYSARRATRLHPYSSAASPFYRNTYQPVNQIYNNQGLPVSYDPTFYAIPNPTHANRSFNQISSTNEMSPYHQQASYNNMYATPPPSNRMSRRNNMQYNGSPHPMTHPWSPFIAASGYSGPMMQIPEELEGQHY